MALSRRNSAISSATAAKGTEMRRQISSGPCTFIRLVYGGGFSRRWGKTFRSSSFRSDNQQLLLNSYASCRRLLDHTKHVVGLQQDGKK